MTTNRSFPPGAGWIPLTVAVAVVGVIAGLGFSPRYENKTIGIVGAAAGPRGPVQPGAQATDDAGGTVDTSSGGGSGGAGGAGGSGAGGGGGAATSAIDCAHGKNGGDLGNGVTQNSITIATTDVTSGVGKDFLGQATHGMQASIDQLNRAGGICGRHINLKPPVNDGWSRPDGQHDIEGFLHEGDVFALVGEPDSEGLAGAIESGDIDNAQIPVVGTDGMLADQYEDPWVWPVASSTVTNMHVIVKYALDHGWAQSSKDFAIIYDTKYKFGSEGAVAFDQEVKRLASDHSDVPGYSTNGGCQGQYCGISSDAGDYQSEKNQLNGKCEDSSNKPICKVVVMLLEPGPAETWWKDESHDTNWFQHLVGGEPLFDYSFASKCGGDCAGMVVWTGYHPVLQPFDAEAAVAAYKNALLSECPSCDTQNEFTEGAYLGTQLFINACEAVATKNLPLTRDNLKAVLDAQTFDLHLSMPLHFGTAATRIANTSMVAYSDNAAGSFNGWNYTLSGFVADPNTGADFPPRTW
jgi:ABC-type branched-subunit amino acid transport system substrate-binding protein